QYQTRGETHDARACADSRHGACPAKKNEGRTKTHRREANQCARIVFLVSVQAIFGSQYGVDDRCTQSYATQTFAREFTQRLKCADGVQACAEEVQPFPSQIVLG